MGNKGKVIRNKVRLEARGFTHVELLDYDETYALVAHLELVHLLLTYVAHKGFKLY